MDPYSSYPSSRFSPKVIIAIAGGVLLLLIVIYITVTQSTSNNQANGNITPTPTSNLDTGSNDRLPTRTPGVISQKGKLPVGVVAKVGKEYLYKDELDIAVNNYGVTDENRKQTEEFILNNMVNQSITLQAGEKAGYLTLDPTIFNSPSKDVEKRFQAYETVRLKVLDEASSIEGVYVSLLFNNDDYSTVPIEEGKKRAFEQMQMLYQKVASGEITLEQAGEFIKADLNNADLDPVFKLHAYRTFKEEPSQGITIDSSFDQKLKQLQPNQLTDLHLFVVQDPTQNPPGIIEVGYAFGKVTNKTTSAFNNFEEWVAAQRKNYEIIY